MAFTSIPKKNNRAHTPKWHASQNQLPDGTLSAPMCPCGGKPQAVSPRLAARQEQFANNHLDKVGGFHKPGSQNRKK